MVRLKPTKTNATNFDVQANSPINKAKREGCTPQPPTPNPLPQTPPTPTPLTHVDGACDLLRAPPSHVRPPDPAGGHEPRAWNIQAVQKAPPLGRSLEDRPRPEDLRVARPRRKARRVESSRVD